MRIGSVVIVKTRHPDFASFEGCAAMVTWEAEDGSCNLAVFSPNGHGLTPASAVPEGHEREADFAVTFVERG